MRCIAVKLMRCDLCHINAVTSPAGNAVIHFSDNADAVVSWSGFCSLLSSCSVGSAVRPYLSSPVPLLSPYIGAPPLALYSFAVSPSLFMFSFTPSFNFFSPRITSRCSFTPSLVLLHVPPSPARHSFTCAPSSFTSSYTLLHVLLSCLTSSLSALSMLLSLIHI